MNVLGIDPGLKPGYYYEREDTQHYGDFADALPWDLEYDTIVTEGVWFGGRATPASIAALSFTAGRQLQRAVDCADIHDPKAYRLPVKLWKDANVYRGGTLPAEVFLLRLTEKYPILQGKTADQKCAFGIVKAFRKLTPEQRKKYLLKDPK